MVKWERQQDFEVRINAIFPKTEAAFIWNRDNDLPVVLKVKYT